MTDRGSVIEIAIDNNELFSTLSLISPLDSHTLWLPRAASAQKAKPAKVNVGSKQIFELTQWTRRQRSPTGSSNGTLFALH